MPISKCQGSFSEVRNELSLLIFGRDTFKSIVHNLDVDLKPNVALNVRQLIVISLFACFV